MSRFNLPVMDGSGAPAGGLTARSLHAEAICNAALGERVDLSIGTAIITPDMPEVAMANEVRDVQPPAEGTIEAAVDEAMDAFRARGVRARKWIFAGGVKVHAIAAELAKRGYQDGTSEIWALASPRKTETRDDLTVIPARASFAKVRELVRAAMADLPEMTRGAVEQNTEAAVRCLDESRVDGILALEGQTPVGLAYLVTAGEAGFVADVLTHPAHRRKKIGATLMERIVELAGRSRHRSLTLRCRADNVAARGLYAKIGWEVAGKVESMRLAD